MDFAGDSAVLYFVLMNVAAFCAFGIDKFKAVHDMWRIPERVLIGLAVIGGSVGAYAGMKMFHHKTRKPKFYIGVPVIFMLQVLGILLIYK